MTNLLVNIFENIFKCCVSQSILIEIRILKNDVISKGTISNCFLNHSFERYFQAYPISTFITYVSSYVTSSLSERYSDTIDRI